VHTHWAWDNRDPIWSISNNRSGTPRKSKRDSKNDSSQYSVECNKFHVESPSTCASSTQGLITS